MDYSHDNPEFPDTYPSDEFAQSNPQARDVAYLDRDDYLDYPKIVFENILDFADAVDWEQELISKHFPNGARLHHSVTKEGAYSVVLSYYWKDQDVWTYRQFADTMQEMKLNSLIGKLRIE